MFGGSKETRTLDPLNANQVLSQLSYRPKPLASNLKLAKMIIHISLFSINNYLIILLFWYNNHAVAMVNYEPGQDRNVAALSILVMCDGFNFYERF